MLDAAIIISLVLMIAAFIWSDRLIQDDKSSGPAMALMIPSFLVFALCSLCLVSMSLDPNLRSIKTGYELLSPDTTLTVKDTGEGMTATLDGAEYPVTIVYDDALEEGIVLETYEVDMPITFSPILHWLRGGDARQQIAIHRPIGNLTGIHKNLRRTRP